MQRVDLCPGTDRRALWWSRDSALLLPEHVSAPRAAFTSFDPVGNFRMTHRIATESLPATESGTALRGSGAVGQASLAGRRDQSAPAWRGSNARYLAGRSRAEARFVFSLAGAPVNPIGGLDASTDWTRLLQIAWDEGATTALQAHVQDYAPHTLPLPVERQLACLALERELRMRILQHRAAETIALLRGAGIQVALLKGAALATTLYPSFTARPMNDVDILVHPFEAEEAKRLTLLNGWAADPDLPNDRVYETHHHLAPLIDARGSRSRLEIHRATLPPGHPFAVSQDEWWSAMRPAAVAGTDVLVLEPTYHAVHIAIHFAWSHTMRAGAWHAFRDLGTMERAGLLDWDRLIGVATRGRAASCCYWTLKFARSLAGVDVPDRVIDSLAPPISSALLARLERHFVNVLIRRDPAHLSIRVDRALWTLAIQPKRHGHGAARPWTVSHDLSAARLRREARAPGAGPSRWADRVVRCTGYVAGLLWS